MVNPGPGKDNITNWDVSRDREIECLTARLYAFISKRTIALPSSSDLECLASVNREANSTTTTVIVAAL